MRERFLHYYEKHELKLDVAFFAGGFVFDVISAADGVDQFWTIVPQIFYLLVAGVILYLDILREARPGDAQFSPRIERLWQYRGLALHFALGALMSVYSIFFLMSASFFSSIVFVLVLFAVLILNELKAVRGRGADVKVAIFVICMFCFFSIMFPLAFSYIGHFLFGSVGVHSKDGSGISPVGKVAFLFSFAGTLLVLWGFYRRLRMRLGPEHLRQRLLIPGLSISGLFLALYLFGLIPPVPLAAQKLGVYHGIEKAEGKYVLLHERPWWKFWQRGDQDFVARPGDKIHFFAAISSPGYFADTVYVRWMFRDARGNWQGSDRIPVAITGGRKEGFRGFTTKQNFDYGDGHWRVSVETVDGREIGRMYFRVSKAEPDPARVFEREVY